MKRLLLAVLALLAAAFLSSCAAVSTSFEDFARAWSGIPATMTTYDQAGNLIDRVSGRSFEISLDERFEEVSVGSDGDIIRSPGDVLLISVGGSHISHVGSTMIIAEDGLAPVAGANTTISLTNTEAGTPWLNNLLEYNRNLWQGKGKTILIRSQDGQPIAVFAADQVEVAGTEVPKSTMLRLDGRRLWVYRADYTMYDNELLE